MLDKDLNNSQNIASAISGFERHEDFGSARDDFYYDDCPDKDSKLKHIHDYAKIVYDIELSDDEIENIYNFLEKLESGQLKNHNGICFAFDCLVESHD